MLCVFNDGSVWGTRWHMASILFIPRGRPNRLTVVRLASK